MSEINKQDPSTVSIKPSLPDHCTPCADPTGEDEPGMNTPRSFSHLNLWLTVTSRRGITTTWVRVIRSGPEKTEYEQCHIYQGFTA